MVAGNKIAAGRCGRARIVDDPSQAQIAGKSPSPPQIAKQQTIRLSSNCGIVEADRDETLVQLANLVCRRITRSTTHAGCQMKSRD